MAAREITDETVVDCTDQTTVSKLSLQDDQKEEILVPNVDAAVGTISSPLAAANRPRQLSLQLPPSSSNPVPNEPHNPMTSLGHAYRNQLPLAPAIGVCSRHPSTPQLPGTCCFQDGHLQHKVVGSRSHVSPCGSPFPVASRSWCCLHDSHPGVDCGRHAATPDKVKVMAGVRIEEPYVFTMTEIDLYMSSAATRCHSHPAIGNDTLNERTNDDVEQSQSLTAGTGQCVIADGSSNSLKPMSETSSLFHQLLQQQRHQSTENLSACSSQSPVPIIVEGLFGCNNQQLQQSSEECPMSLTTAATALVLPEMASPTLRRRRSISAECGKNLEAIAEEAHGGGGKSTNADNRTSGENKQNDSTKSREKLDQPPLDKHRADTHEMNGR